MLDCLTINPFRNSIDLSTLSKGKSKFIMRQSSFIMHSGDFHKIRMWPNRHVTVCALCAFEVQSASCLRLLHITFPMDTCFCQQNLDMPSHFFSLHLAKPCAKHRSRIVLGRYSLANHPHRKSDKRPGQWSGQVRFVTTLRATVRSKRGLSLSG